MWWRWDQPHFGKILHFNWWSCHWSVMIFTDYSSINYIYLKEKSFKKILYLLTCRQVDRQEFTLNHIHISLITKNWYTFLLIIFFLDWFLHLIKKMITFIVFQPKHLCDKPWVYFAIYSMQNDFTLRPSTSKWIRVIHFQGVTSTVYQIVWLWSEGFPRYLVR